MFVNGEVLCDKCDRNLGNGNVYVCMTVSRVNPETGGVENWHFCEDVKGDDDKVEHKGCARSIMTATHLKAYNARTSTDQGGSNDTAEKDSQEDSKQAKKSSSKRAD